MDDDADMDLDEDFVDSADKHHSSSSCEHPSSHTTYPSVLNGAQPKMQTILTKNAALVDIVVLVQTAFVH